MQNTQQVKIPSRFLYVARDLLAQGFHGGKFDFVAEAIEKADFDFAFGRQFEEMEIQQVSFNGKRVRAEGGAIADVGD
jgi:hypothetical protein